MKESPLPVVLRQELWFPKAETAVTDGDFAGLVALGGDLTVERLQLAYRSGIFPWSVDPITWWSPDPRGIIPLDHDEWPRSLRKLIRRQPFEITMDSAFTEVMIQCASMPRPGAWISSKFIAAFTQMHRSGHAHSVECWQNGELVGGVYGVALGGLFAGESMFHHVSNASKVSLFHLVAHLRERGFLLFDTQMVTETTERVGAIEIPRSEYLKHLRTAIAAPVTFS